MDCCISLNPLQCFCFCKIAIVVLTPTQYDREISAMLMHKSAAIARGISDQQIAFASPQLPLTNRFYFMCSPHSEKHTQRKKEYPGTLVCVGSFKVAALQICHRCWRSVLLHLEDGHVPCYLFLAKLCYVKMCTQQI